MSTASEHVQADTLPTPSFQETVAVWWKIGLLSFGGPAAQIALMHRLIVEQKRWLSDKDYLGALSFCMLLPGPEAMQLATYAGWKLHGTRGGLAAGLLFVIPGAAVILVLATVYAYFGNVSFVSALFLGIKAAVIIVVVEALFRVAKKALLTIEHWYIAIGAFVAIFFFNIPYPIIILAAAVLGALTQVDTQAQQTVARPDAEQYRSTLKTVALWLCIWFAPLLVLWAVGADALLQQIGKFFSTLAVVTFGGAYAVLAYLAQDVVSNYGWLTAGEMMDGLGLAETTPGPLILVTEFVGFLAGFNSGGFTLGVLAALVTLWVTFAPCFMWIFAGAPYIDWISDQPRLKGALAGITAAVVGVILNLSVWFAVHVMFTRVTTESVGPFKVLMPEILSLDWRVVVLTALCAIAAFVWHWSIVRVLLVAAVVGLVLSAGQLFT